MSLQAEHVLPAITEHVLPAITEPVLPAITEPVRRRSPAPVDTGVRSDRCVADVEAMMRTLVANRGVLGPVVQQHLGTGGKRLRARLALAAAEALGAGRSLVVPWAAACELLHNATLIHDDLQDGDRTRRGHPTVWAVHGSAQAVNAGDLLLMLPYLAAERVDASAEVRLSLVHALASHAASTVRGQAEEIVLGGAAELSWSAYRRATVGKTCALFLLPVEGAALLAGRSRDRARTLAVGFEHLGILFQMQDDVLDLWGSKGRETPGSDLREGKISALVVEHLRLHPEDAPWLRGLLALPREATPDEEVHRATERFRSGGALRAVLDRIEREAKATERHPAFRDEPALRSLALEIVRIALAPISHVRNSA